MTRDTTQRRPGHQQSSGPIPSRKPLGRRGRGGWLLVCSLVSNFLSSGSSSSRKWTVESGWKQPDQKEGEGEGEKKKRRPLISNQRSQPHRPQNPPGVFSYPAHPIHLSHSGLLHSVTELPRTPSPVSPPVATIPSAPSTGLVSTGLFLPGRRPRSKNTFFCSACCPSSRK